MMVGFQIPGCFHLKRAVLISVQNQNLPKAVRYPQEATMIDLPLHQKPR